MSRVIDRRRMGVVAGVALAFASIFGLTAPSFAQTASGSDKAEPAKVEREGYYTAQANGAVPATLTKELPPGIVCIVIPQVCGSTTQPVTTPLGSVVAPVTGAKVPDYQGPQSVEPGTLPVGLLGGKPRYTSYLKFAMPAIPSGSLVDRFELVLTETQVSYALESPAFRQAILAGLVTYEERTPDEFVKYIGSMADQTTPLATNAPTGIELCAVTAPWPGKTSQDAATQPPRDCIFGANGVRDPASKTWTFDLSFLAQAWLDGTTPNEGVYLGPIGSENLAFGDQDTSTNWQVSLGGATSAAKPQLHYAFSEGFGDTASVDDFGGAIGLDDANGGGDVGSIDAFVGSFDAAADTTNFAGGTVRTPGSPAGIKPAPASNSTGKLHAQLVGESRPRTPWWLWLLLPLGLAVAYGYGRSVEETPPAGRAGAGALTRLMNPADGDARPPS